MVFPPQQHGVRFIKETYIIHGYMDVLAQFFFSGKYLWYDCSKCGLAKPTVKLITELYILFSQICVVRYEGKSIKFVVNGLISYDYEGTYRMEVKDLNDWFSLWWTTSPWMWKRNKELIIDLRASRGLHILLTHHPWHTCRQSAAPGSRVSRFLSPFHGPPTTPPTSRMLSLPEAKELSGGN